MGKYLIKKLIANKEEKKVVIKPTNSGYKGKVEYSFIELKNSTKDANEIDGIPSKKENIAASLLSHPDNRAIEMVIPERETPGIIANAWAIPIKKLSENLWCFKSINLFRELSAKSIKKDIEIDIIAIERFERRNESLNSGTKIFIIPPKKIIGIVAIKIDKSNLLDNIEIRIFLDFLLEKLNTFFLKYQTTAKTLPICMIAESDEPGSSISKKRDIIFKWAVLLTGMNSVKPWISP